MQGLPYTQFFTGDWLNSSARVDMTTHERAIYLDLLFQIWERGGAIPGDHTKLAKMAMVTLDDFAAAWPAISKYIVAHPDESGMLTNLKMLGLIAKHEAKRKGGRLGGEAKAQNRSKLPSKTPSKTLASGLANAYKSESESESESELTSEENICAPASGARVCDDQFLPDPILGGKRKRPARDEPGTAQQLEWFALFWAIYWLAKSRKAALAAFCKHVTTEERFQEVMAAVAAQSAEMQKREPRHRPHASTWLNGERWQDQIESVTETIKTRIPDGY